MSREPRAHLRTYAHHHSVGTASAQNEKNKHEQDHTPRCAKETVRLEEGTRRPAGQGVPLETSTLGTPLPSSSILRQRR